MTETASTKDKLLMSALELFSQKGYSATTVDEIAKTVGVTGPSIYKYFKGKAALLEALIKMADETYKAKMSLNKDPMIWIHNAEELKTFSVNQVRFTLYDEIVVKLRKMYTIEQFRNEVMSEMASTHQYANLIRIYTDIFRQLLGYGKIGEGDPELLALEYVAPITLLIQRCDRNPEERDEAMKRVEKHIDYFVRKNFV